MSPRRGPFCLTAGRLPTAIGRPIAACALVVATLAAGVDVAAAASSRVGYSAHCSGNYVYDVRVSGYGRNLVVAVTPTAGARQMSTWTRGQVSTYNAAWDQVWQCVKYPAGLYGWQGDSLYQQLACHVKWSYKLPTQNFLGGPIWALETWRPSIGLQPALSGVIQHRCNWV